MRYLLALALVFLIGCAPRKVGYFVDADARTVVVMHNDIRQQNKKELLNMDTDLEAAAQKHADWMAANKKLSHTGPRGSTVADRVTRSWQIVGENIAYGYPDERTVVDGWMGSKGHKANILNGQFTMMGVGFAASSDGTIYWCVVFAGMVLFFRKRSQQ